jgi:hypothetical protein
MHAPPDRGTHAVFVAWHGTPNGVSIKIDIFFFDMRGNLNAARRVGEIFLSSE